MVHDSFDQVRNGIPTFEGDQSDITEKLPFLLFGQKITILHPMAGT